MTRKAAGKRKAIGKRESAGSRKSASRLEIVVSGSEAPVRRAIRRVARFVLAEEGVRRGSLEVAVVGGAEMRRLHKRWMNDPTSTDVLTFDLRDKPVATNVDGQLVVCESVARQRAGRKAGDWQRELLLYVVHGCLHLCGYDDRRRQDAARMHLREDELLVRLGIGPVYVRREGSSIGSSRGARACSRVY